MEIILILTRPINKTIFNLSSESSSVVELHLAKVAVAGSSPVSRFIKFYKSGLRYRAA
jgi:hypothetical protein